MSLHARRAEFPVPWPSIVTSLLYINNIFIFHICFLMFSLAFILNSRFGQNDQVSIFLFRLLISYGLRDSFVSLFILFKIFYSCLSNHFWLNSLYFHQTYKEVRLIKIFMKKDDKYFINLDFRLK